MTTKGRYTVIFFTTYRDDVASDILDYFRSKYEVMEFKRSSVVKELYYLKVKDAVKGEDEEVLKEKAIWWKIDILEFK